MTSWTVALHSVHGIFQARILEWVAFPSPRDLPNPGIKPGSPADSLSPESPGKPEEYPKYVNMINTKF